MNKIIAIIPSRSGSKSIKNKNLKKIKGKSLLQRAVEFALSLDKVEKVIVSTDSLKYQKLALSYGAECPFLRPKNISGDYSLDVDVFMHCLNWLKNNERYIPNIVINLRPTYPFRKKKDFDLALKKIIKNKNIESIKSVCKIPFPLEKTWLINKNKYLLNSFYKNNSKELCNLPRQKLPNYYIQNGNIDIVRSEIIMKKRKMSGTKIYGIIQSHFFDIDNLDDLIKFKNFK